MIYAACFAVYVQMPAHRSLSFDWPILEILITHVMDVQKPTTKMYPVEGKTC